MNNLVLDNTDFLLFDIDFQGMLIKNYNNNGVRSILLEIVRKGYTIFTFNLLEI
jgi:hypothetical protein